ncbi:MAG: hypothetical protein R3A11_01565 [Bdellovibrionota bacterium]
MESYTRQGHILAASLFFVLCCVGIAPLHAESSSEKSRQLKIIQAEMLGMGRELDSLRRQDVLHAGSSYEQGGDLITDFIRFLFPISGREKRTMFLPTPYWGKKKPQYKKFKWSRYESDHFDFFAYPEANETLKRTIGFFEEEYERNNRTFGVSNRFSKKIPVILYHTRRDFEQTSIVDGPVPLGLGGLTEVVAWKRVTFPFEGEMEKFEHVAKHEQTHVFQIAKDARKLPLWMIEGVAETNSIYWDSDAEMILRDAFINGFFYKISDLWQIQGPWLMYKIGNFICNVIWEEYGERGIEKIFQNASEVSFEKNIKDSLGITVDELEKKVEDRLVKEYGHLLHANDVLDSSRKISEREKILTSYDQFFVSGGVSGPSSALYLNVLQEDGSLVKEKIVEDRNIFDESLEYFQKGADLTDKWIVYSVKQSKSDQIKIVPYHYEKAKKKIIFDRPQIHRWEQFERIQYPNVVDEHTLVFIGYKDGYSNLYRADLQSNGIEPLTQGQAHISHLDYNAKKNQMVYSKETQRLSGKISYNRELFLMDLSTKEEKQITFTQEIDETEPMFSHDGGKILYVANPDATFDLMVYEYDENRSLRLTRMRVGAKSPSWGPEGSILFNAYEKLSPHIYQKEYPKTKDIVQLQFPESRFKEKYAFEKGTFELYVDDRQEDTAHLTESEVFDGQYLSQDQVVIRSHERDYTVQSVASASHELIYRSFDGLPETLDVQEDIYPQYFVQKGRQVISLRSKMVAEKGISDQVELWSRQHLNGRPIVEGWTSQNQKYSLLLVNNRMASEYREYRSKSPVGIVIYDSQNNHAIEWSDSMARRVLENKLQWVSFLEDDSVFLAVGEKPSGPFQGFIWKNQKLTYQSSAMLRFSISQDHRRVAWLDARNEMHLLAVSASNGNQLKKITYPGKLAAFEFVDEDHLTGISTVKKDHYFVDFSDSSKNKKIPFASQKTLLNVSIDRNGWVAFLASNGKADNNKEDVEFHETTIELWNLQQKESVPRIVDWHDHKISHFVFRDGYLTYIKRNLHAKPNREVVWTAGLDEPIYFDPLQKAFFNQDQRYLVLESKRNLVVYDRDEKNSDRIGGYTMGVDVQKDKVLFSQEIDGRVFVVSEYNLYSKVKRNLSTEVSNSIYPIAFDDTVLWSTKKDFWNIDAQGEKKSQENVAVDVLEKEVVNDQLIVDVYRKNKKEYEGPLHDSQPQYPGMLLSRPAPQNIKVQNLSAAAAFDGSNFRYFVSGYADNLFSDRGIFVNSVFLGSARYASIGYSDLRYGYSGSFFFNSRRGIDNYGIDVSKNFILDQYRQVTLYSDFEYQNYSVDSSVLNSFIEPKFNDSSYYLLKAGFVYSFDGTSHDFHGPIEGSRFFFRTESGVDTQRGELSNIDANIDFRLYHEFLPRLGLAHRFVAGTSQGSVPNIYIMGGNVTFRGIPFEDLAGQNYWVASQDLRLPVFDFIGAKFFDPLDQALGFLTRFFDVRSGLYVDVGSAWSNSDDMTIDHSFGYFVNVPTTFGLIFRFNQGLVGRKSLGFWIGTNW